MRDAGPTCQVEHLIRANGGDLLAYFLRRVDDPADAADLLSELFVVIWRRRDALPTDVEEARRWCFGVARNTLRDHRRGRVRRSVLADELRQHLRSAVPEPDPAAVTEIRERESAVRAAVKGLDARSRELIILVHWDGFSINDAADHLGLNASTARTRYGRARARLAVMLSADHAPCHPPAHDRPRRPVRSSTASC